MPFGRRTQDVGDDTPPDEWVDPQLEKYLKYWRRELKRYGVNKRQTDAMIDAGADMHSVRRALEQGCPPDTAFLIFS